MLVAPRMPRDRVYSEMMEPVLGECGGQDDVVPFSVGDTVEVYSLRENMNENGMRGTIKGFLPGEGLYIISFEVSDRPENIKLVPEDKLCFHVGATVELHDNIGTIKRYLEDERQYVISFEFRVRPENIKLVRKL